MRQLTLAACIVYLAASVSAIVHANQVPADIARSVWDGVYTDVQATRGRTLYNQHCAECHGADLGGREGKALTGDTFWMSWRETTVADLLDYVSKNMPFSEDGSLAGTLSPSTYADIVAHVLQANGFPAGAAELTSASSAGARIMARDGPGELPASTLAQVVGCLERGTGRTWRVVKATRPERVTSGSQRPQSNAPLGNREFALMFVLTSLDKYVGSRVLVTGSLIGEGGVNGLNVSTVAPLAEKCE